MKIKECHKAFEKHFLGLRIQKNEFPKTVKESVGPFDDLPFIWKEFERNNYTTAMIEDDPWFTLFNYLASGFKKQPTNWYTRPYWVHIYNENKDKRPVTHNDFNRAQNVDSVYASFISEMKQEINDRRVEERMPLFAIHLPHKLLQFQPHLRKYLKLNKNRLTTWLDAHKVLQDIANFNFSVISESDGGELKRAYSFIREKVPLERDCESALIPENYCVCDEQREIAVNQSFVEDAAMSLVTHVNKLLSSHMIICVQMLNLFSKMRMKHSFYAIINLLNGTSKSSSFCSLPLHFKPFDKEIEPFIVKMDDFIDCPPMFSNYTNLTFVDNFGVLRINKANRSVDCFYQQLSRSVDSDDTVVYDNQKHLPDTLDLKDLRMEFVSVKCFVRKKLVYENAHFYPSLIEETNETSYANPSVIILVLESTSRLNYLRFMPKTRHEFESLENVYYLKGFHKVGLNSYPNMVPFLTGLHSNGSEFPEEFFESGRYFDYLPFIWDEFKQSNYTTAFIEESDHYTLFNYLENGFIRQPTDWYPRPYWMHVQQKVEDSLCFKGHCIVDIFLDQIKVFVRKAQNIPKFVFAFLVLIDAIHEDFNTAQLIDSHYANFFNEMKVEFNRSIVILMGDHGSRVGPQMETYMGKVESSMPLFAIHMPQSLIDKHPHIHKYLTMNSERLITFYDAHKVLYDVAKGDETRLKS
ncbi:uncharacterized protein B4U80_10267 [Leptotrombidium deliense]|uniref:Uncharacterized protein n=1 Tax=Leptotrombidium deliense TaxID=299467 RepID=A0A443SNU0_9ACAR|nr:uncharacterized protein B4U80_10267 [Leptotrombidium deliense]